MAMSTCRSIQEMQAPITCQLCEESTEIKWKCLQCNFLMCSRCKKIHQKVKSSDQHKIIDIKDIHVAKFQQHSSDPHFNTIECGVHAGQICCLFCQTCEEVVCPSCIAKTHNEHKMTVMNEAFDLAMKSIKCINSEVEQKISEIVTGKSKLGAIKSSEKFKYAQEKKKVLARNNLLKDEVNKLTQKLLNELDQKHDELMKSVNREENKSVKLSQDLELRNNNISKVVSSNNAIQVFSTYKEEKLAEEMEALQITTKFKTLPEFLPGNIQSLELLYGKLHVPEDKFTDSCFEFKVIQQYKTDMPLVEELICGNDGLMWISFTNGKVLQQICLSKGSTRYIQAYDVTPLSIALLPSGDLLISSMKSNLYILSQCTGSIKESNFRVAPLQTVAVHVTKTNQIIVGAREKGPPFPVNGPRQVIIMNMKGEKKMRYHLDNKGNPIFSQPRSITTDSDNNIYVLDLLSIDITQGRIVSLNNCSGVKWTYDGHQMANKELLFAPTDFVTTPLNNIIVADNNHMIHILNRTGECIHFLHTKEFDIHWPRSIDIDKSGTLYIGCKITNKWDPWEAKVHVVQFSGF